MPANESLHDNPLGSQGDSWQTWPGTPYLDEEIAAGDERERSQEPWEVRVGIKRAPSFVVDGLLYLRRPTRLKHLAPVSRYVSRTGLKVLRSLPAIRELRQIHDEAYLRLDELRLARLAAASYDFGDRLGVTTRPLWAHLYFSVASGLADISHDTGLSMPTVTILALAAGLAMDRRWLPEPHVELFMSEVERFDDWLTRRLNSIS